MLPDYLPDPWPREDWTEDQRGWFRRHVTALGATRPEAESIAVSRYGDKLALGLLTRVVCRHVEQELGKARERMAEEARSDHYARREEERVFHRSPMARVFRDLLSDVLPDTGWRSPPGTAPTVGCSWRTAAAPTARGRHEHLQLPRVRTHPQQLRQVGQEA
jgi:hypothetical protein